MNIFIEKAGPLTYMKDILIIAPTKVELPQINGAVKTGFGKEKTKQTMERILRERMPSLVISVGLVGAVVLGLKVGDIFIPEFIIDYNNLQKRYHTDPLGGIKRFGTLVTVPMVFKKEDKYKLKKILPSAIAVDMETSAVAEVLGPMGIPLLCIKAVSDELDFDFIDKGLLSLNIKKAVKNYSDFLCEILKKI